MGIDWQLGSGMAFAGYEAAAGPCVLLDMVASKDDAAVREGPQAKMLHGRCPCGCGNCC